MNTNKVRTDDADNEQVGNEGVSSGTRDSGKCSEDEERMVQTTTLTICIFRNKSKICCF